MDHIYTMQQKMGTKHTGETNRLAEHLQCSVVMQITSGFQVNTNSNSPYGFGNNSFHFVLNRSDIFSWRWFIAWISPDEKNLLATPVSCEIKTN